MTAARHRIASCVILTLAFVSCSDGGGVSDPDPSGGTPGISLTLDTATASMPQGGSGTVSVSVTRQGGFDGPVELALEGAPQGVTGSFSPDPVPNGSSSSTLTLSAGPAAALGTVNLVVRATADGVAARTAVITLTVETAGGQVGEWSALGEGVSGGFSNSVHALAVFDDGTGPALYAAGVFSVAGEQAASKIARWNGSSWSPLGAGLGPGSAQIAHTLAVFDDGTGPALYAGGTFTTAGEQTVNRIARWNGSSWSAVGGNCPGSTLQGCGANQAVHAMAVYDDGSGPALYVGGSFTAIGGQAAQGIAKWDGAQWAPVGNEVGAVYALAVFDDGAGPALYAGGLFSELGGAAGNRIAKWDGSAWSPLGPGVTGGGNPRVLALAVFDDGTGPALYVGGYYSHAGGERVNNIARWDGSSWSGLGQACPGSWTEGCALVSGVNSLVAVDDGADLALYVGGDFGIAAGLEANRIASWDGTDWSTLQTGMDNQVMALAVLGGDLYAGGHFTTAGGTTVHRVARWSR